MMRLQLTLGSLASPVQFGDCAAVLPLPASNRELPSPQCSATPFFANLFTRNPGQRDSPCRSVRSSSCIPLSVCDAPGRALLDSKAHADS